MICESLVIETISRRDPTFNYKMSTPSEVHILSKSSECGIPGRDGCTLVSPLAIPPFLDFEAHLLHQSMLAWLLLPYHCPHLHVDPHSSMAFYEASAPPKLY